MFSTRKSVRLYSLKIYTCRDRLGPLGWNFTDFFDDSPSSRVGV